MLLDIGAEVAIGGGVRCRIRTSLSSEGGEGGNAVALLPLVSLTESDHSLHRGCQSGPRAGSLWLQTDADSGGENRLGDKDIMVVMGLIIAAVVSLPYRYMR